MHNSAPTCRPAPLLLVFYSTCPAATVFYPIAMWIRLYKPSPAHRAALHALDVFCLVCSLLALVGAVQQIVVNIDQVCFFCE